MFILRHSLQYAGQFATCLGWYTGIGTVHIATEYCELGDLDRYLPKLGGRLFETDIYDVTWQILSALRSLHEQGFSHGGLKLSVSPETKAQLRSS
jgi:serine/threonine protein kinase